MDTHLVTDAFEGRSDFTGRRLPWHPVAAVLGIVTLLALTTVVVARAQDKSVAYLAERSTVVISGKVLRVNASDEPLVAASSRTAVILVRQMYAGRDVAGDQTGRVATVILSQPGGLRAGDVAMFFGNPLFIGHTLTMADEGEIAAAAFGASTQAELKSGLQARQDAPILAQLARATLVFRGTVAAVRPLVARAQQSVGSSASSQEHDPQWQIATVRISERLSGADGVQEVTLVFAGSRDIVWFNAPKLKVNQDAVFIAHAPTKTELALYATSGLSGLLKSQPSYLVTDPSDVLPPASVSRVRALLLREKEIR